MWKYTRGCQKTKFHIILQGIQLKSKLNRYDAIVILEWILKKKAEIDISM